MLCQCFTCQFIQQSLGFICCQERVPLRIIGFNLRNFLILTDSVVVKL